MIHIVRGNLLNSDCTVIIHQANCFAKMGAGIAKQIRDKYPESYVADKDFGIPVGSKKRLGLYSAAKAKSGQLIFNMYSQYHYGRGTRTDYKAFEKALRMIIIEATHSQLSKVKIGLPYGIGCGLAGGDWSIVQNIINKISEEKNWPIYLYKL